ncbi:MAG: CHAT domain-containing tetratricopeptide repeat protein [Planctomycetota bacterium]
MPWPPWGRGLEAVHAAAAESDAEPLRRALAKRPLPPGIDVALVATLHGQMSEADGAEATALQLTARRVVAEHIASGRFDPRMGEAVEHWLARGPHEAAADHRLCDAFAACSAAASRRAWEELEQLAASRAGDMRGSPDSLWACEVLRMRGFAALAQARADQALAWLEEAASRAETMGWPAGAARAWQHAMNHFARRNEPGPWEETARRVVGLFDRAHEAVAAAAARRSLAVALLRQGRLRDAVAEGERALDAAERAGDALEVATSRRNLAEMLLRLGRFGQARSEAERAREELLALGRTGEAVAARTTLATIEMALGRWSAALQLLDGALADSIAQPRQEALVQARLGALRNRMGDHDEALVAYRRALELHREAGEVRRIPTDEAGIGTALRGLGRYEEALTSHVAARDAAEELGSARPGLQADVAEDLRLLGRHPDALVAFARARELADAGIDPVARHQTADHEGRLLRELGRADEALERHQAAWHALAELGHRQLAARAAREAAEDLLVLARPAEARAAVDAALDLARSAVDTLGDGDAEGALDMLAYTADLGLRALRAARASDIPGTELARHALRYAEEARAGQLAHGIEHRVEILAAHVPARLLEEAAEARAELMRQLAQPAADGDPAAARRMALERFDAASRRVQRAARLASVAQPSAPDVDAILECLAPTEALVVQAVAGPTLLAIVATNDSVTVHDLGDLASSLQLADGWLDLTSTPGIDETGLAARLGARLIEPLRERIGDRTKLVIVPDVRLASLPWPALIVQSASGARRLVDELTVSLAPSGTVLALLRSRSRTEPTEHRGAVVLGDPTPGPGSRWSALPGSGAEARAVAELYPGKATTLLLGDDADRARLVAALARDGRQLQVLHMACHAHVDRVRPRMTALQLAGGDTIGLDAIAQWDLGCSVAFLTACDGARGAAMLGEGPIGFPRALLMAGAERVIASCWRVDDEAARELVLRVHEGLARDGLVASEALARAQRERLHAGGPLAHPYYWAGWLPWGLP